MFWRRPKADRKPPTDFASDPPRESPVPPTPAPDAAEMAELRRLANKARVSEFYEKHEAAIAALPPEPQYLIWQQPNGMWAVGTRMVATSPQSPFDGFRVNGVLPDTTEVKAWSWHEPFAPTFRTEAEARKWLKDYVKPPIPKRYGFDAEGHELAHPTQAGASA